MFPRPCHDGPHSDEHASITGRHSTINNLPRRSDIDAGSPTEPMGAAYETVVVPSSRIVELTDQDEQTIRRCLDMGGELGDLIAELLDGLLFR